MQPEFEVEGIAFGTRDGCRHAEKVISSRKREITTGSKMVKRIMRGESRGVERKINSLKKEEKKGAMF